MNQYIDYRRLQMVFSKYWFESRKPLLLLFCSIAAFLTMLMSLYYSFRSPGLFRPHFQVAYYFFCLFLSGMLTASFLFSDVRSKPRAISYLLLPASQLEKFICVMFFGVVVFWVGYSLIFTGIDYVFVTLNNARMRRTDEVINLLTINEYQNPFIDNPASSLYYLYFGMHALFALGSVYFIRYAFFKTLLISLVFWACFFFMPMFLHAFLPPGTWVSSLMKYEVFDRVENPLLVLPQWFRLTLYLFFSFCITGMLWIATYIRFTERQIA